MNNSGTNFSDRVGLYVRPATRNRLNLYKAELSMRLGRTVSQSEAVDRLLDQVGIARRQAKLSDAEPVYVEVAPQSGAAVA